MTRLVLIKAVRRRKLLWNRSDPYARGYKLKKFLKMMPTAYKGYLYEKSQETEKSPFTQISIEKRINRVEK